VPGFVVTGEPRLSATGSEWGCVRSLDGHRFVLKTVPVMHLAEAQTLADQQMSRYDRVQSEHLIRRRGAFAMADGMLALLLDEVAGGGLAQLIGARGQLTVGEMVTTVAPLFRALADLHTAGVVHGDLSPGSVLFTADGRPMIGDLGVARLLGEGQAPFDGTSGFAAPELVAGGDPSPGADTYALAAIGWFCLTGAPPDPAAERQALTTLRPETPPRVAALLTACLSAEPAVRPSAAQAAVELFNAAPAESVALASTCDPAADITRRIRAAAVEAPEPEPRGTRKPLRRPAMIAVGALLVVAIVGVGATWATRRSPAVAQPVAAGSPAPPSRQPTTTSPSTTTTSPATTPRKAVPARTSRSSSDVVTASNSPKVAAAGLLQALVDARALAYLTRNPALLDLVYAPGATKAAVDRANIAAALKNGGTYLGLSYVIRDVTYLGRTTNTARLRATILTPAYQTGQPDGREIPHPKETLGPCVFSLSLTADGWRIVSLTVPG
jgi:eukaryotic-like serine/threonine-protein kinase